MSGLFAKTKELIYTIVWRSHAIMATPPLLTKKPPESRRNNTEAIFNKYIKPSSVMEEGGEAGDNSVLAA